LISIRFDSPRKSTIRNGPGGMAYVLCGVYVLQAYLFSSNSRQFGAGGGGVLSVQMQMLR